MKKFPKRSKGSSLASAFRNRKKVNIRVNRKFCKQCGICVHFCHRKVLSKGEDSYITVINPELCTNCRLCELMCPEFALDVEAVE